jgi:hypothetical protein
MTQSTELDATSKTNSATPPRGLQRLALAIGTVWAYSLSGIVVGGLLVYEAADLEAQHKLAAKLLEHLGMGFIVAAIAVLFYEWGAHIKDSIRLSEVSLKLSDDLAAIKGAVGENALEGALRVLIRGEKPEYDDEMVRRVAQFVDHVRDLQTEGDWARAGYARFLYRLLKDVTDNAESLRSISAELRKNPVANAEYHVLVPSPAALTDIMLAEQMRRLPRGGKYSIASNPRAWQANQLNELHEQSQKAVENGVIIRRIFVLTHEKNGPHAHTFDAAEAAEMIRRHFDHTTKWIGAGGGAYEIKLLDDSTRERLATPAATFIFNNHFGVFEVPNQEHAVLVQVNTPDLSDLRIRGASSMSPYRVQWEAVWSQLPVTTPEVISKMLAPWVAR